jgi:hypothetical protein
MKKHILIALAVMVMACKKEETTQQQTPPPPNTPPTPQMRLITFKFSHSLKINNEPYTMQTPLNRMFEQGTVLKLMMAGGSTNMFNYLQVYQDTLVLKIETYNPPISATYTVK